MFLGDARRKEVTTVITLVEAFTRQTVDPIVLADPGSVETDPIQILKVDGLGPVKAAVTTTPFGDFDGESLPAASVGKRNIVLTFGLNPDWADQTFESLRAILY